MTDDPMKDFAQKCAQEEEWKEGFPTCDECGSNVIDNGDCYYSVDGIVYCEECMKKFRVWID